MREPQYTSIQIGATGLPDQWRDYTDCGTGRRADQNSAAVALVDLIDQRKIRRWYTAFL